MILLGKILNPAARLLNFEIYLGADLLGHYRGIKFLNLKFDLYPRDIKSLAQSRTEFLKFKI